MFAPLLNALEGIRAELKRSNELSEAANKMAAERVMQDARRYAEARRREADLLACASTQTELIAVAHGYERTDEGYQLRPRERPEKLPLPAPAADVAPSERTD